MNTSNFPVTMKEKVVCFSFFPALLLWSAISGVLIWIALALRNGHTIEAIVVGAFFAVVFTVTSHIAYGRGWVTDWPVLTMRLVVGVVAMIVITLVKWLVYDDSHLLSYAITYLVLVSWVMFVTGSMQDCLARWYCAIKHNPKGC